MPETVTLADGSQREVLTADEQQNLQTAAQEAATLKTTVETLTKEKQALESDPANRNWKQIREVNEKLKDAMRAQGKEVKEDGTITEAPKTLTAEEIEQRTRKVVQEENVISQKKAALSKFPEEKRKVVEHYLNKLTAGEELSPDNIEKFVSEAAMLADPQGVPHKTYSPGGSGQPPLLKPKDGNSFAETDAGKSIANELFGADSFAQPKK